MKRAADLLYSGLDETGTLQQIEDEWGPSFAAALTPEDKEVLRENRYGFLFGG